MQGNENIMFCSRCGSRNKNLRHIIILSILGIIFLKGAVEEIPSLMEELFEFDVIGILVGLPYLYCELAGLAACILTGIRKVKNNDKLKIPTIVLLIISIISIISLTLFTAITFAINSHDIDCLFSYISNYTVPYVCIYVVLLVSNIYTKK